MKMLWQHLIDYQITKWVKYHHIVGRITVQYCNIGKENIRASEIERIEFPTIESVTGNW